VTNTREIVIAVGQSAVGRWGDGAVGEKPGKSRGKRQEKRLTTMEMKAEIEVECLLIQQI